MKIIEFFGLSHPFYFILKEDKIFFFGCQFSYDEGNNFNVSYWVRKVTTLFQPTNNKMRDVFYIENDETNPFQKYMYCSEIEE